MSAILDTKVGLAVLSGSRQNGGKDSCGNLAGIGWG